MALMAAIEDGKVVESASQSSLSKSTKSSNDSMDKDAFLQLLVAQMKYQDPLEPTSNTEYIAQYAQFSQVEQMQNMANSMTLQRASSLVGQYVYVKTTGGDGNTNYVEGTVDYVVYEGSKAYLAIDEQLYSIDDLDTVADSSYINAYKKAEDFVARVNKLDNPKFIDMTSAEKVDSYLGEYENMTDYEKSFVAKDVVTKLNDCKKAIEDLKLAAEAADNNDDEEEEETESSSDTVETE
ncbi:MAG: flagellar hook capping protein [Lachnospiraceae bacterium]|nr:flagellar hook capping protein [Lachnospiraceae bacterium]